MSSEEYGDWQTFYQLERQLQEEANSDHGDGDSEPKKSSYLCDCPDNGISLKCPVHGPHSAG